MMCLSVHNSVVNTPKEDESRPPEVRGPICKLGGHSSILGLCCFTVLQRVFIRDIPFVDKGSDKIHYVTQVIQVTLIKRIIQYMCPGHTKTRHLVNIYQFELLLL